MSNIDITHMTDKGASLGVTDLVGGQVSMAWISPPAALPLVKEQQLRALGVTTAKRTAL